MFSPYLIGAICILNRLDKTIKELFTEVEVNSVGYLPSREAVRV